MDTVMEREQLEKMLDKAMLEITEKTSGLRLHRASTPPSGDLCTVHITFKKGFHSSLTLCADSSMLIRMTGSIVGKDRVSAQDLEDFSKEYFNILCGKIAGLLYQATKVSARFSIPSFYKGRFAPEGQDEQFAITYSDDHQESVQLAHHISPHPEGEGTAP